ncbi:MAG: hypothetical protein Q8O67_07235 [Deltaproteobacteria bacterium]|nr:hypothetical protein [Deltaproteobacteria bacterium]
MPSVKAAKETALATAGEGKELLIGRWRRFREESPYFQAKVALVLGWLVISIFTALVAPPPPETFIVETKMLNFGLAEKTTLIIFNQAGGDLDTAAVEVTGTMTDFDGKKTPGKWATKVIAIPQGLKTTLSTESFFDAKGVNPGYQLLIDVVVIKDDGDEVWRGPPRTAAAKR